MSQFELENLDICEPIQFGDIVFLGDNSLAGRLNRIGQSASTLRSSRYSHVGIYIGNSCIFHAIPAGIKADFYLDVIKKYRYFSILRAKDNILKDSRAEVIKFCQSRFGLYYSLNILYLSKILKNRESAICSSLVRDLLYKYKLLLRPVGFSKNIKSKEIYYPSNLYRSMIESRRFRDVTNDWKYLIDSQDIRKFEEIELANYKLFHFSYFGIHLLKNNIAALDIIINKLAEFDPNHFSKFKGYIRRRYNLKLQKSSPVLRAIRRKLR